VWEMCGFVVSVLVMGCCMEVYVPHQGAAVPDSRSLSWSFTFVALFFAVAGSCFSRLPARREFLWVRLGA